MAGKSKKRASKGKRKSTKSSRRTNKGGVKVLLDRISTPIN